MVCRVRIQYVNRNETVRVDKLAMDRKKRILSFLNTEISILNSRTKYIICTICKKSYSLREFNSHVKKDHSTIYKRRQCNYCFNFSFKTPLVGKQHKLNCLSGKILSTADVRDDRESDLLNKIKEKDKIINTQYLKIKELEVIINQLSNHK